MSHSHLFSALLLGAGILTTHHAFPADDLICTVDSPVCHMLNRWHQEKEAAGLSGIYYDNRDRGHSKLYAGHFPQLNLVTYTNEEDLQNRNWGGQQQVLEKVVVGNASTAASVEDGGSNVRGLYEYHAEGVRFLYLQYRNNNLYIYPEHQDYDAGHNGIDGGYGDLYPTNSPYVITSLGSSGSDQPFLEAFLHTIAAFPPKVQEALITGGLLMPTVQAIFRNANKMVVKPTDYLKGKAHPSVFDARNLNVEKMATAAHAMTLTTVPPLVRLKVVSENCDLPTNYGYTIDVTEKLCDTPMCIGRIWRGAEGVKTLVIDASESYSPSKKPILFHWTVLQGDAEAITITLDNGGTTATLSIPYSPRRPIAEGSPMESNRIDIGVFADDGTQYSAPAFVTLFTLDNEIRTYDSISNLSDIFFGAEQFAIEVTDWNKAILAINSVEATLPTTLLRSEFTAKELEDLSIRATPLVKMVGSETTQGILQAQTADRIASERTFLTPTGKFISLKEKVNNALLKLSYQYTLITDQAEKINAWASSSLSGSNRQTVDKLYRDLEGEGWMDRTPNGLWTLCPLSTDNLTDYEKYRLRKWNLSLMNDALYAEFLRVTHKGNYVDQRLSAPQDYRIAFHYGTDGKISGWTHTKDGATTYEVAQ